MTVMTSLVVRAWILAGTLRARLADAEEGEGVVSLAIGVVIMAFLGVLLWVAFKATLGSATDNVNQQVAKLGQ